MMLRANRLIALLGCALLLVPMVPALAADTASTNESGEWIYTIQPGDTLSQIAHQHLANTAAWQQLQKLNRVADPNKLRPGSTLRIPNNLSSPDLAQAEVLLVRGTVTVSRGVGTPSEPLATGSQLRVGSTVETGVDGLLTLRFADQSRMLVSPNSRLTLTHLQFRHGSGEGVMRATLENGSVESQVAKQKGVDARFEIKTPSLNLAVRGTTFRVQLDGKTGLTRSSVLEGSVKASNDKGSVNIAEGFGSIASPGRAPGAPRALLAPPMLAGVKNPVDYFPTRFDWQALKDAQQYRVEIVEEDGVERLVQTLSTRDPHSAWTALANGNYRIRVRGIDLDGLEGRDAAFAFKVAAWPTAPMVNTPREGAVVAGERIRFRWARVTDADFLRFQVARDPEFKDIVMQVKSLSSRSGGMAVPLKPGRYFWRIASGKKQEGFGPFGPVQSFEVAAEVPRVDSAYQLRWQAATPGERYKIQVATHDSFAEPLIDREQADSELDLPKMARTMYVRMKRIAADGFPGEFEPVQIFEVGQ